AESHQRQLQCAAVSARLSQPSITQSIGVLPAAVIPSLPGIYCDDESRVYSLGWSQEFILLRQ
ncbi:MAG: hypothetical protein ACKVHR_18505, partial [Pirellulales bacterium]